MRSLCSIFFALALSTSESIFNIALPAVATGACQVEFVEASGEKADVVTGQDLYTAGLLMGIQSRYKNGAPLGNCWSNNYHMYKYELKSKDAAIKVVAIDRFGNEYTETKITAGTDYTLTSGDYKTDVNL